MPLHSCIPVWSYEEAFYAALMDGVKMAIRTDPLKGKGLFATEKIHKGETIHEETALVCSQNMDDLVRSLPVCTHCLKSLETPRRVVGRVCRSKKMALALPYGRLLAPETPVPCVFQRQGCRSVFCSARCRQTAWERYHSVLCVGRMESDAQDAYDSFLTMNWVQNGVDYSDTAAVALRAIAQCLTSHRMLRKPLEESFLPFSQLIRAPLEKFFFSYLLEKTADEECGVTTEESRGVESMESQREQYKAFQRIRADPLSSAAVRESYSDGERTKTQCVEETLALVHRMFSMDAEEKSFLSPEKWSTLLGAVLLNGQERSPPSYYSLLKDAVETALTEENGEEKLRRFEEAIAHDHKAVNLDDLNVSTRGQGIYAVGCLFNHSCAPNIQVVYANNNDETLVVMALRDIEVGEELCISYIEESMTFPKRQTQLFEHYLFECRCSKCAAEATAFKP